MGRERSLNDDGHCGTRRAEVRQRIVIELKASKEMDCSRAFAVASEENLIGLIKQARRRLVVVCPAVTNRVADALTHRLADEGKINLTIILDADPEVYRLGYGTEAALDRLRAEAASNLFDLRVQQGVRIGLVISDDMTMVFSPVPLLIEAGSTSREKPNAIVLSGGSANRLAEAAGAGLAEKEASREIGKQALTPAAVDALKQDLKTNPPQSFDVARALRVFTSRVQYVEFEIDNYRLSTHGVELPQELLDISDGRLRKQISGRLRFPDTVSGPFRIKVETAKGEKLVLVDAKWLAAERKRIEQYTFVVPNFGRVIFSNDRSAFDCEISRFERNLERYHAAVVAKLDQTKSGLEKILVKEYLPRWRKRPPCRFGEFGIKPTPVDLERELRVIVQEVIQKAVSIEKPRIRAVYKNIAPESVRDPKFTDPLKQIMRRRKVPVAIIESLFKSGDAAPASQGLLSRPRQPDLV